MSAVRSRLVFTFQVNEGQRGGRAHRGLASVRWGGRRVVGRLRRRCMLPDEACGGIVPLGLSPLQGGVAAVIEQLGWPWLAVGSLLLQSFGEFDSPNTASVLSVHDTAHRGLPS